MLQLNSQSDKEDDDMDKLKMSGGEGDDGTGDGEDHTEDDMTQPDGEHGREMMLSVVLPHKVGDDPTQVTEHQIIWMPAGAGGVPQPPTLYSIKQLNYSQEAATSTQSASSDSNDSCDEKMMITIAGDDQDVGENSN